MSDTATPWIVLRGIGRSGDGVRFEATSGVTRAQARRPDELRALLEVAVEALDTATATVPVFVERSAQLDARTASGVLRAAAGARLERVSPVWLSSRKWEERAPVELPLTIAWLGPPDHSGVEALRAAPWFRGASDAGGSTVRATGPWRLAVPAGEVGTFPLDSDVIVVPARLARVLLRRVARLPHASRPRLVIALGRNADLRSRGAARLRLPGGTALVRASGEAAALARFPRDLLGAIARDEPVHDAARAAAREVGVLIVADPATNDGLRLAPAAWRYLDRLTALGPATTSGRLAAVFSHAPARRQLIMRSIGEAGRVLGGASQYAGPLTSILASGKGDLVLPMMARMAEQIGRADAALEPARAQASASPELRRELAMTQERRADVALRPLHRSARGPALLPGSEHRLHVRIGQPFDDGLVREDVPSVDTELRDRPDEGHDLAVTVFGLDFEVLSVASKPLHLPLVGASTEVSFRVRAPDRGGRRARLRVALYHRGHMIQAFLVRATVGEADSARAPTASLEFSRSRRFAGLDTLGPRALSIAVNQAPGASHQLMMVDAAGKPAELRIDPQAISKDLAAFRALMQEMKAELVVPPHLSGDPASPSEAPHEWWRKLAREGRRLHDHLFLGNPAAEQEELLRGVWGADDRTIQVVRLDPGFVYPWGLLYDWRLPQEIAGAEPPPFCFGAAQPHDDDAPVPPRTCGHKRGDRVFCIYGFWGVRHRLEQLVGPPSGDAAGLAATEERDTARPEDRVVAATAGAPALRLLDGIGAQWTGELREQLEGMAPGKRFVVGVGQDPVEALWDSAWRPATVLVVAHHARKDVAGEPVGSRMRVDPEAPFLTHRDLLDRLKEDGGWSAPESLVMLLGCETGTATPTALDDFATAFARAGAAGVISTELPILSDLAARCARVVTADLFSGASFGDAVTHFHRRLAHAGNPLAFSFAHVGDAEVHVAA